MDSRWEYEFFRTPETLRGWNPEIEGMDDVFLRVVEHVTGYDPFCGEHYSWYEWEKDMRKVSSILPGLGIKVISTCMEDVPDAFHAYFLDGRMQYCQGTMVFPPFDESLLK